MPDKITYEFTSKGLKDSEKLIVTDFRGSEAISEPYEYTVSLKSESADIDMDEMLSAPCTFLMTVGRYQRPVHGCLSDFEQLHQADQFTMYRAVLVPRLWQLTLYKANEIYLKDLNSQNGTTVPDIIEIVLKECGFTTLDYKMQLSGSYPRRPYRCQWNETHFQYISRLMEHEGICYYFDQDKASEKIVFCDSLNLHKNMKDADVNYAPVSGVDIHTAGSNIRSLVCRKKRMPKTVVLQDYNYEKPSLDVTGTAVVDEKGVGEVFVYGDNFKTPEEGNRLAKIRAEEMFCTKEQFHGEGMVSRMTPGYLFELRGHFRKSLRQKYLITEIEHEGVAPSYLTERGRMIEEDTPAYANSFTAIPASVQFRPERVTPKSRFHGMINAVVDGRPGSDPYADLDDIGRYKTILPFDRETRDQPGNASWWFRKAEPHAGKDEGMHFPLRKDTEVLLSFIDGDPDRPVISSAIANPRTPNVVDIENRSKNVFRTHSGNLFEMEDMTGSRRIKFFCPCGNTYMHLGAANAKGSGIVEESEGIHRSDIEGGVYWQLSGDGQTPTSNQYDGTPWTNAYDSSTIPDEFCDYIVWNFTGDRYTHRSGNDINNGPDREINLGNGYVENRTPGNSMADWYGESFPGPFSRGNDLGEKTWGNVWEYRKGNAYTFIDGKDYGFYGGDAYNYAGDVITMERGPMDSGSGDIMERTFCSTYDYQNGNASEVMVGNVDSKMYGNTNELVIGNTISSITGNTTETIVGNTISTVAGNTSEIVTGAASSIFVGGASDIFVGVASEISVSAASAITIGAASDIFIGLHMDMEISALLEISMGPHCKVEAGGRLNPKSYEFQTTGAALKAAGSKVCTAGAYVYNKGVDVVNTGIKTVMSGISIFL